MGFPTEDEMRAEFRLLQEQIKNIEEGTVAPLRKKYDKISQDSEAKLKPLIKLIKEAEAPLFELKNQMGAIVRALGGRTGDK